MELGHNSSKHKLQRLIIATAAILEFLTLALLPRPSLAAGTWSDPFNTATQAPTWIVTQAGFDVTPSGAAFISYSDNTQGPGHDWKANVSKCLNNWCAYLGVANNGFSTGQASRVQIAVDPLGNSGNGAPYVVYSDNVNGDRPTVKTHNGSDWVNVGGGVVSAAAAFSTNITLDSSGRPYVVFAESANGDKATVMRFNGSNWVTVGSARFTSGGVSSLKIVLDGNDVPYVVFMEGFTGPITVMKFDGIAWATVGSAGFSAGNVDYPTISLDLDGTPYVAYMDLANESKATVKKFNGTSWVDVGTPGISAFPANNIDMAISSSGAIYVSYTDNAYNQATVMAWNGSVWFPLGGQGSSAFLKARVDSTRIAVDGSGNPYVLLITWGDPARIMKYSGGVAAGWSLVGSKGFSVNNTDTSHNRLAVYKQDSTPYVMFSETSGGTKANVMKLNGNSWSIVGTPGISAGSTMFNNITLDSSGMPYVAFEDFGNGMKAIVKSFDGSNWVNVGSGSASSGPAMYVDLKLNSSNVPYVVFVDATPGNGQKGMLARFDGTSWAIVGNAAFSSGPVDFTRLAFDSTGVPYVVFRNMANGDKANVMSYFHGVWSPVGSVDFTSGSAAETTIALDSSDTPYVAFVDGANGYRISVMRYLNRGLFTGWFYVGTPGFSAGAASEIDMKFDNNGTLFVSYRDDANASGVTVKKFSDGAWHHVGSPGFSDSSIYGTSIDFDGSNVPYLLYSDSSVGRRNTVMRYFHVQPDAVSVVTLPAYFQSTSTITLGGMVNTATPGTAVSIEYGPDTSYGTVLQVTPATVDPAISDTSVWTYLSGLPVNTPFHYRLKAENAWGVTYGNDVAFTIPCAMLTNGGFESGSTAWSQLSTDVNSILCNTTTCGTDGNTIAPLSGTWWARFGGAAGISESSSLTQKFEIAKGATPTLQFWIRNGSLVNNTDYLKVLMDGQPLYVNRSSTGFFSNYAKIPLDLTPYADGAAHTLSFQAATAGGTTHSNFSIDDVSVVCEPTYCSNGVVFRNAAQYLSIQEALNTAVPGDTLKAIAHIFQEDAVAAPTGSIKLAGGYDCYPVTNAGYSVIKGSLKVRGSGRLAVENVKIR